MILTGRLIVTFAPRSSKRVLTALNNRAGLEVSRVADSRDFIKAPAAGRHQPLFLVDELGMAAFDVGQFDAQAFLRDMEAPIVGIRAESFIQRPQAIATGPLANDPASIVARGNTPELTWAMATVGVKPAEEEGQGVVVALLDSGVQKDHPDLRHAFESFEPISFVPGKRADVDDVGHGTHCAGLIVGGKRANGPRYGVASRAQLLAIRIFDTLDRAPELDVAWAAMFAAGRGAHIISLSAGRTAVGAAPEDNRLALALAQTGTLLVAAAGNESDREHHRVEEVNAPANARGIPAVGAVGHSLILWNQSNGKANDVGGRVDVVAPGVDVISADPDGGTTGYTGTSVATPIVAGIAAVLKSREPHLSPSDLVTRLREKAIPLHGQPATGVGAGLATIRTIA